MPALPAPLSLARVSKTILVALAMVGLWCAAGPACRADAEADDLISAPAMPEVLKTLGFMTFAGRWSDAQRTSNKAEVRRMYWAFMPDVRLSEPELERETARFESQWQALVATSKEYGIDKVSFIGFDNVAAGRCIDMYFVAASPRGPVLFRFSVIFRVGDRAKLHGIEVITGWDRVKRVVHGIQHPTDRRRMPLIEAPDAEAREPNDDDTDAEPAGK